MPATNSQDARFEGELLGQAFRDLIEGVTTGNVKPSSVNYFAMKFAQWEGYSATNSTLMYAFTSGVMGSMFPETAKPIRREIDASYLLGQPEEKKKKGD